MKQFLEDYGLRWINNDVQKGEFKLKALMDDLTLAKDELLYNWDTKTFNLLNLDSLIDKVDTLNQKYLRGYKPVGNK